MKFLYRQAFSNPTCINNNALCLYANTTGKPLKVIFINVLPMRTSEPQQKILFFHHSIKKRTYVPITETSSSVFQLSGQSIYVVSTEIMRTVIIFPNIRVRARAESVAK